MPLYVYTADDASGEELERFYHRDPPSYIKQDGRTFRRSEITRFSTPSVPEPMQGDAMLKGYHDQECAHGSRFRSRFDAETIKRAWRDDHETPADRGEIVSTGTP